jgi:hypothetical protein
MRRPVREAKSKYRSRDRSLELATNLITTKLFPQLQGPS